MAKIAFLGLGAMGLPMAKRLCAAKHQLKVTVHRNQEPAKEIAALGGQVVGSAAKAVADVDFVVSILPEDAQIVEVLLDPAVVAAMDSRTILIEMSSATAEVMKRLAAEYAKKGVRCFDAPVSGGLAGAANGTLTVMGGGEAEVLEAARPVLSEMAGKIYLVGGVGAGKAMKAVNQLIAASNAVVVAEALSLARSQGIDPDMMFDVVSASSGASYTFTNKFKKMVEDDFVKGFKLSLMMKDMRIALAGAGGLSMPVTTLAYQMFQMLGEGNKDLDFSVVSRLYEGKK